MMDRDLANENFPAAIVRTLRAVADDVLYSRGNFDCRTG
jgi:hypothetical protein